MGDCNIQSIQVLGVEETIKHFPGYILIPVLVLQLLVIFVFLIAASLPRDYISRVLEIVEHSRAGTVGARFRGEQLSEYSLQLPRHAQLLTGDGRCGGRW
jgi:hypothetical protein